MNPFYRFRLGWNAGFYPDNQIVSDLLAEIYVNINGLLPGWATIGTTSVDKLLNTVYQYVETYNQSPYFGDFNVSIELNYPSTNDFRILIKNNDLFIVDSSQFLEISSTFSSQPVKIINSPLSFATFSSGTYVGTFEPTLINTEKSVEKALTSFKEIGSATFPITYYFDKNTNTAISGLARGKNWKLNNGIISRFPAPQYPYQNQRIFSLPATTPDDNYILKIIERIIQASLVDSDYTNSILETYNQFSIPSGWTSGISHPSFLSYERVEITFDDSVRRKFILVGRKNTNWLWQRFVSDDITSPPFDFLSAYTETTALPYEVTEAGMWLYPSSTYDLEFVEFENQCHDSKEFYAMPAKPGDVFQFNIHNGNILNNSPVNIGLFTESGQFIQKIGQANLLPTPGCECVDCGFLMQLNFTEEAFQNYLDGLNAILDANPEADVFTFKYVYLIDGVEQTAPESGTSFEPGFQFTTTNIFDYLDNPVNFPLFTDFKLEYINGLYRFSLEVPNAVCGSTYQFMQYFRYGVTQQAPPPIYGGYSMMWDSDVYECPTPEPIYQLEQHQASVTIPSKDGCYRMGLYDIIEGGSSQYSCNLALTFLMENNEFGLYQEEFYLALADILATSPNPYISFTYTDGAIYTYPLSNGITPEQIASWCTTNIPGMYATGTPDVSGWQWQVSVPCNENGYVFSCYHSDSSGNPFETLFESPANYCQCTSTCTVNMGFGDFNMGIYPFENILSFTDQYVGIILFDYSNPPTQVPILVYKRPVSDFYISPGTYNIGAIYQWINNIPGFHFYDNTRIYPGVSTSYTSSWMVNIPCTANVFGQLAFMDIDNNVLENNAGVQALPNNIAGCSQDYVWLTCCQCNSQCEQTFTYVWNVEDYGSIWTWMNSLETQNLRLFAILINEASNTYSTYAAYHPFYLPIGASAYDKEKVITYLNTVPGLSVVYDDVANTLTFNWTLLVPCDTELVMRFAGMEFENTIVDNLWTSEAKSCSCQVVPEPGQFYSALYSLSNIIKIDNSDCFSSIIQFWAESNSIAEGNEYYNDWYQQVRLGINGGGQKPIISESIYRQSNGVHRRPSNKQDLSIDLHTDFLDLETQTALVDATRHPNFVVNGQNLFVTGDIEVATIQDFSTQSSFEDLAQVKFSALIQGYQPKNSTCVNC